MPEEQEKAKVIIYTPIGKLRGTILKMSGGRLIDIVNFAQRDFLAITDVEIINPISGKTLEKADFVAINRKDIIALMEEA